MPRRLVAILAADAVGFSRLMHDDEDMGLTALERSRRLLETEIARHHGRIFAGAGDSVLAEFASAVDAVLCAVESQRRLSAADGEIPEGHRLAFRMGINLGDVITAADGNLFGDCVNLAARLETVAKPGGICLSEDAYRQVRNRGNLRFDDLGPTALKNVGEMRVYQVAGFGEVATARDPPPASARTLWKGSRAGTGIAVLPFDNLSSEPKQEYFCDGLVNDIITDLSRFPELLVIASNSAFAYKGRHCKAQDVAAELGVSYLLEGSVQRLAKSVRVNAQLIEGATGHHIWVERFERDSSELFQLQEEIIRRIVGSLPGRLRNIEGQRALRKDPVEIGAYEAYLRGSYLYSIETPAVLARCREQFEQAAQLDPSFARAWGYLAYLSVQSWLAGWSDDSILTEAEEHARLAVSLDPDDYANHWDMAFVYFNTSRIENALDEYGRAVALNPNDADLLSEMADTLVYAGETERALRQLNEAMRRNPYYPDWYLWVLGWALFNSERYEEARAELNRMGRPPEHVNLLRAGIAAKLGDDGDAAAALGRFLSYRPGWTIEKERARSIFRHERDRERWLTALADAGLPLD